MQKYLVPLDGSALAEQALPLAKERAKRLSGSLLLVRVVNVTKHIAAASMAQGGMEPASAMDIRAAEAAAAAETREAREYLQKQADGLRREGIQAEWEVRTGLPAQEIIAAAKEKSVDVIVITTHGRSGLGRMVFGSVADEVIRAGVVPVLVYNSK